MGTRTSQNRHTSQPHATFQWGALIHSHFPLIPQIRSSSQHWNMMLPRTRGLETSSCTSLFFFFLKTTVANVVSVSGQVQRARRKWEWKYQQVICCVTFSIFCFAASSNRISRVRQWPLWLQYYYSVYFHLSGSSQLLVIGKLLPLHKAGWWFKPSNHSKSCGLNLLGYCPTTVAPHSGFYCEYLLMTESKVTMLSFKTKQNIFAIAV